MKPSFRSNSRSWLLASLAALPALVGLTVLLGRPEPPVGPVLRPHPEGPVLRLGDMTPMWVDTLPEVLSVADAVEADGGWVLLDRKGHRVHVLGEDGAVRSFGREGEGPGELVRPQHLTVVDGVAVVVDGTSSRADFFDLEKGWIERSRIDAGACLFGPALELLAAPGHGALLLQECTHPLQGTWSRVSEVNPGAASVVVHEGPARDSGMELEVFDSPLLGRHGTTIYIGDLASPCLSAMPARSADPRVAPTLCHPTEQGPPLPDSIRAALEAFAAEAARVGKRMPIPDRLPPLSGIQSAPGSLVFRIPLADGGEVLDMVVAQKLVRLIPEADTGVFFGAGVILVTRDTLEGTELRLLQLPASASAEGPIGEQR